jgi:predicted phage terminase large subunit-like protein
MKTIKPQPGPQEAFLSSTADIAIYGGAAGAGKTFALLLEPTHYINVRGFGAVTFRRTIPQITGEGGLWDTSFSLYPSLGGRPINQPLKWTFPDKVKFEFHHLQHEKTVYNWDGTQIPLLMFDELQHFEEKQFFYMLTRNRSTCGVRPYCRATCNPDPDSFLCQFLISAGFVNEKTGFPEKRMSGKVRYFVKYDNQMHWASTKKELLEKFNDKIQPKSFTFIPGNLKDNKILTDIDPGYESNLLAQPQYEQDRLLKGNWFARPNAGDLFKRHYWKFIEEKNVPYLTRRVRAWDRAATVPSETNPDPDWTAGVKVAIDQLGNYYVMDVQRERIEPGDVEALIYNTIEIDGMETEPWIEQDPGQAGKFERAHYERQFSNKPINFYEKGGKNKLTMWKPFASVVKAGRVFLVIGDWNEMFIRELESVTDGSQKGHDDQADAASVAYAVISEQEFSSAMSGGLLL